MPQVIISTLDLYVHDSSILYQHNDVKQTEKWLNEDFKNLLAGLLITNWVFILVRIGQNLFFLQVNEDQRISVN